MRSVQEIKDAIIKLKPTERGELCGWLDQHYPSMFDARIEADVAAGRLDGLISHALNEERNGRLKPL